ncbi:hypothetical protein LPJ59_001468 [Coemansia sp. RSA 2399]|nr:hypothetical protein LPJ59_001468 [Coemansia sp. RSA 2399]
MFSVCKTFYGGFPDTLAAARASIINRPVTQSDTSTANPQAYTPSLIINIINANRDALFESTQKVNKDRTTVDVLPRANYVQAKLIHQETSFFSFIGYASVGVYGLMQRGICTTSCATVASPTTTVDKLDSHRQAIDNGSNCADVERIKHQLDNRKVCVRSDSNVQKAALRDIINRDAHSRGNTRTRPDVDQCVNIQQSELLIDEMPPFEYLGYATASSAAASPTTTANNNSSQNQAIDNGHDYVAIMEEARAAIERMNLQLDNRKVRVHNDYEVQKAVLRDTLTRSAHLRSNTRDRSDVDRCVNIQQSDLLIDETPPFECLGYVTASTAHALGNQNHVVSSRRDCVDIMEKARTAIENMKLRLAKRKVHVRSDFEIQKAVLRGILARGAHSRANTREYPDVDRCVNIQQSDLLIDEMPPFLD